MTVFYSDASTPLLFLTPDGADIAAAEPESLPVSVDPVSSGADAARPTQPAKGNRSNG